MTFTGISYLAVLIAAAASFGFGALWYSLFAKQWMAAIGISEQPAPTPAPFITAAVSQLVMAYMMAGLLGHFGEVTPLNGAITAFFIWLGFVATTLCVNHRFQSAAWSLTFIDAGHWLGGLLLQGLIIGWFGT